MVFATRYNKKTGAEEQSVRYYISSKTANARYFHHEVRSHWGIENKLHWCMDVIFGEDKSKKQAEESPQNFSLINKVALNMIRNYKPDEARGSKKISMIRKRKMATEKMNNYLIFYFHLKQPCNNKFMRPPCIFSLKSNLLLKWTIFLFPPHCLHKDYKLIL